MKTSLLWLLALILLSPNSSYGQPTRKSHPRVPQGREGREMNRKPALRPPAKTEKRVEREGNSSPQKGKTSGANRPLQDNFVATYKEIKLMRPTVDDESLRCDAEVIRIALPEIQQVYLDSRLTKENAQEAALAAWKEVRLASPLQPDKCMDSSSYKTFTLSLGTLVFKTNPPNADIALNADVWTHL